MEKTTQRRYTPLRALLPELPGQSDDPKQEAKNLRAYVNSLVEAIEYLLEHLTVQQFADGEIDALRKEILNGKTT